MIFDGIVGQIPSVSLVFDQNRPKTALFDAFRGVKRRKTSIADPEAWDEIPVAVMNNFVLSFQNKCAKVVVCEEGKERGRVMRKLGRPPGSKNKPKAAEKKPTAKKSAKKHAK